MPGAPGGLGLALLLSALSSWPCVAESSEKKVTVHLVAHTHDDVGWLKTVDQYYTGQNNSIQHAYVKMILDTVVESLADNPNRKFTYVEQAFFVRWWRQQSERVREITRRLVKNGQLSFTNGGWCMHDEATPFYLDMIDQTTLGHKFLMDTFGFAPKTGWQLDPFGHSATQAALLSAEVGLTGLFFGRIDYQDLALRVANKSAEFVWRASPSLGGAAQVFSGLTGEYHGAYGPPGGFDWDIKARDEPVQDDPQLKDYNVQSRVDDFVRAAMDQASHTRGSHVMWTMGADFQYEIAREWFENLDRIIKYVNQDGRVSAVYSTPEKYLAAKASEDQVSWPLKTDDFFPYADGAHQFWTGYFTSRPAFKRYIRDSSAFLQVMRQLQALGGGAAAAGAGAGGGGGVAHALAAKAPDAGVEKLSEAMGVAQHHDAVSGTAKQHVTFDYAARIADGRAAALPAGAAALARLAGLQASATGQPFSFCELRNVSVCLPTQDLVSGLVEGGKQEVLLVLWNGLAQDRREVIEVPTSAEQVQVVLGASGDQEVTSQVLPSLPSVTNYGQSAGGAKNTLVFTAEVPALGFQAFRLIAKTPERQPPRADDADLRDDSVVIENEFVALEFCEGSLCKITNKKAGVSARAKQSWFWYKGSVGNAESGQASGAYIFRSNQSEALPVFTGRPSLSVVRGAVADEVHQTFGPWVSQRIRLAHDAEFAEITYTVGPIPVDDGVGKEVVSRITTDIANAGGCFTDSNGREMLARKRDFRPSWQLKQTEPVAGNYFPVTTAIFIRDQRAQLTALTDSAQAGSGCVHDGELELMVHRSLLHDDARGVGEPLHETEYITPYVGANQGQHYGPGLVVRGRHLVALSAPAEAARVWRPLVDKLYMPLQPFFASQGAKLTHGVHTALRQSLPANVQMISLQQWDEARVMLRLAHQFGLGEDAVLSKPVTVDLGSLFADRRIQKVDERGLAVTISREEVLKRRIPWHVEGEPAAQQSDDSVSRVDGSAVTLGPLQIRTFLIEFAVESAQDIATFV